ncbi:MerR family transcriptional regulator [uncultured Desulfuromonas sp.]|uniref:MerR family transcriptional regulator n=1 Tax=uncultured Desulfuromonas sp. TaxID=181013 RepID=UPI002AAC244A|nr:MerR family transcriptional regulator [uncultured Desulfuromonas sp.]
MALVKTWYDIDAAAEKFGIKEATLKFWALEGLVRSEREEGDIVRVHIDDVRLQVADMIKEAESKS